MFLEILLTDLTVDLNKIETKIQNYLVKNRGGYNAPGGWGGIYKSFDGLSEIIVLPPEYNSILSDTEKLYLVESIVYEDYFK